MVKPINLEEMKPRIDAASRLKQETAGGQGDPLSRRLAEAILESNENMRRQNDLVVSFTESINDSSRVAVEASKEARKAVRIVEAFSGNALKAINTGTVEAVAQAIPKELSDLVAQNQEKIIEASRNANVLIQKANAEAEISIKRSQEVSEKYARRSQKEGFFFSLGGIGRIVFLITVIGTVALLMFAGWRCLPLVRGEAQITYTQAYQSELDETKIDLIKAQNELMAYKEAFPEGLAEQRLHDLNEKNAEDISNYQMNT